jgi:hypothetical protein
MDIVSRLLISVMRGSPTWNFSLVTKRKEGKKKRHKELLSSARCGLGTNPSFGGWNQ